MKETIRSALTDSRDAVEAFLQDDGKLSAVEQAAVAMISALKEGGTIFSCGNGGSMSDAMHFAEELSGRYRKHRAGLSAIAISDPGHISCVANDYGYEQVFSRYIEAHGKPGDVLLAISTSGSSKNVLAAAAYAREHGMGVISLTGKAGSELSALADVDVCTVDAQFADRVQELHIKIIHILIELIERSFFPENY